MERYEDWRSLPPSARGAAVALGNFDGVHRGHAHVLGSAHAARPDAPLAVLTFEPHPRELFRPEDPPFHLSLASSRADALAALGVSRVFEVMFDRAFSLLPAEQFITAVLHEALGAVHLACGPDFAFGHRRGGDVRLLAERAEALGMGLTIVPPLADAQGPISSSRIRRALQDGYPERATADLGRPWSIRGTVTHGDARGRTIGFPTANIALGRQIEPARGVYAVSVALDGRVIPGVANIGRRPTVAEGRSAGSRRICSTMRAICMGGSWMFRCTPFCARSAGLPGSRSCGSKSRSTPWKQGEFSAFSADADPCRDHDEARAD